MGKATAMPAMSMAATSNVFKAGHRIRVYVASSNFPRFNRNLNTGEKTAGGATLVRAKQTIYHDAEHPSAIVLPIIPRAGEKTTAPPARGANPAK